MTVILFLKFSRLMEMINGVPRPRPEDFEEKESDEIDYRKLYAEKQRAEKQHGMTILQSR